MTSVGMRKRKRIVCMRKEKEEEGFMYEEEEKEGCMYEEGRGGRGLYV